MIRLTLPPPPDLSILKSLGKPASSIPSSVRAIIPPTHGRLSFSNPPPLPSVRQIWYESLLSFILFVPAVTMTVAPLEDITWRGEMQKRYVPFLGLMNPCRVCGRARVSCLG